MLTMPAPKGKDAAKPKQTVAARIDADTLARLNEIADAIEPRPSQSEMIDWAVREFVKQHKPKKEGR